MAKRKVQPVKSEKVIQAEEMGRAAFAAGKKAIPAHDASFLPLLSGNQVGEGLPLLDAWIRGWHTANAQRPVEF
jgi:hypothetical protein